MSTRIQLRRDTAANWTAANPVLASGEMGVETDTLKFKFGNGSTVWNSLAYSAGGTGGGGTDVETVRDLIGSTLVAGENVVITVNDAGDTVTIASSGVPSTRSIIAGTGLSGGGDMSANRTFSVNYGTIAGTAAQGNDLRLSDARTPTPHTHPASQVSDFRAALNASILAGENVTVTYNETTGTTTIGAVGGGGGGTYDMESAPADSVFRVRKVGTTWPNRPSARTDIMFIWIGAPNGPAEVTAPAVNGMYPGDLYFAS